MAPLLEEEIDSLQGLDDHRDRCQALLEAAARTLVSWAQVVCDQGDAAGSKEDGDWASAQDGVERAMILRSINILSRDPLISIAKSARIEMSEAATHLRRRLSATNISSLYKSGDSRRRETPPHDNDRIPVFRACHTMQALIEDPSTSSGPFCNASLNCLYRLMTDIYRIEDAEWQIGAVRASLEAPQSAFITREAVRSILLVHQSLTNTAKLIDELHQSDREWQVSESAPPFWRSRMSELRRLGFETSRDAQWPHLLTRTMKIKGDNWTESVCTDALNQIRDHWHKFSEYVHMLRQRDAASPARSRRDRAVSVETHGRVTSILGGICDTTLSALTAKPGSVSRQDQLRTVSAALNRAATGVLRILEPSEIYLETVLLREVSADPSRTAAFPDAAQAAFAAAALTQIRRARRTFDSDDLHLQSATALAVNNLSERGISQLGNPFDVSGKGYRLLPQAAETIRAICDMLCFSGVDCEPETARRLVRYFLDTRADRPEGKAGWHSDVRPKAETEVWATALAFNALLDLRNMLDTQINRRVLSYFTVSYPDQLKLALNGLFWPDTNSLPKHSIGVQLHAMRKHVQGNVPAVHDFSLVLFGPPGTGKSTLLEALAKSSNAPFVEVTPSDILIGGSAQIERRSRLVFSALSMLTRCVILFDECDSILYDRSADVGPPRSELQFLTPGLLPKLKRLHDRAAKQRLAYALATNYLTNLDDAAIRSGRFDRQLGVYPPDLLSRTGRLATEMQKYCDQRNIRVARRHWKKTIEVINNSKGYGLSALGKPGWFTSPALDADLDRTLFGLIFNGISVDYGKPELEKPEKPNPAVKPRIGEIGLVEWKLWDKVDRLDQKGQSIDIQDWRDFVQEVERHASESRSE